MTLRSLLLSAVKGVTSNMVRSALTTLGIIIGIASVITTLALGNGARVAVDASFRFLGSDELRIRSKAAIEDGLLVPYGKPLTYEDGLLMSTSVALVDHVDMWVEGAARVRSGPVAHIVPINGTTADAPAAVISEQTIQPVGWENSRPIEDGDLIIAGRFFNGAEALSGAAVCVLGYQTGEDLLEGAEPLGETIVVNRQRCLVIGVLARLEAVDPALREQIEVNELILMPIGFAARVLELEPDSQRSLSSFEITAHVSDEREMEQAKSQVTQYLRDQHAIEMGDAGEWLDDFTVTGKQELLGAQQQAAETFSVLLMALSVVSLIVGGIGIMNVMLVSVMERTREIGIRLAVGARPEDIVAQFVLESILLSAAGGIVGIAVGALTIPLASHLSEGRAVLDPASVPLAAGIAVITGILFGAYPAVRASRLDPVEALRRA